MLWYKSWLETRRRWLVSIIFYIAFDIVAFVYARPADSATAASTALSLLQGNGTVFVMAFVAVILGGAGIDTRPAFQGNRGVHESRLFTLSLPVTRRRLLAVRAGVGWLEMVTSLAIICFGSWAGFAPLRTAVELPQMLRFTVACVGCATGLYGVSMLLSSFLGGTGKLQVSVGVFAALWWTLHHLQIPVSVDAFWRIDSTGLVYTIPWAAMMISVTCGALLFLATLKIVRTREY